MANASVKNRKRNFDRRIGRAINSCIVGHFGIRACHASCTTLIQIAIQSMTCLGDNESFVSAKVTSVIRTKFKKLR